MLVYGALRIEGVLELASGLWGTTSFVGYGMLVRSYAENKAASRAWLKNIKRTFATEPTDCRILFSKIMDREIKSMEHLRIMAGSTFYYDKPLLLTIMDILVAQSVNLLIIN